MKNVVVFCLLAMLVIALALGLPVAVRSRGAPVPSPVAVRAAFPPSSTLTDLPERSQRASPVSGGCGENLRFDTVNSGIGMTVIRS